MRILSSILVILFSTVVFTSCKKTYRCKCDTFIVTCGNCYGMYEPLGSYTNSFAYYDYKSKNIDAAGTACNNDHSVPSYTTDYNLGNTVSVTCDIE